MHRLSALFSVVFLGVKVNIRVNMMNLMLKMIIFSNYNNNDDDDSDDYSVRDEAIACLLIFLTSSLARLRLHRPLNDRWTRLLYFLRLVRYTAGRTTTAGDWKRHIWVHKLFYRHSREENNKRASRKCRFQVSDWLNDLTMFGYSHLRCSVWLWGGSIYGGGIWLVYHLDNHWIW